MHPRLGSPPDDIDYVCTYGGYAAPIAPHTLIKIYGYYQV